jgi:hypothetical protein
MQPFAAPRSSRCSSRRNPPRPAETRYSSPTSPDWVVLWTPEPGGQVGTNAASGNGSTVACGGGPLRHPGRRQGHGIYVSSAPRHTRRSALNARNRWRTFRVEAPRSPGPATVVERGASSRHAISGVRATVTFGRSDGYASAVAARRARPGSREALLCGVV